jgi:hypothetical protein
MLKTHLHFCLRPPNLRLCPAGKSLSNASSQLLHLEIILQPLKQPLALSTAVVKMPFAVRYQLFFRSTLPCLCPAKPAAMRFFPKTEPQLTMHDADSFPPVSGRPPVQEPLRPEVSTNPPPPTVLPRDPTTKDWRGCCDRGRGDLVRSAGADKIQVLLPDSGRRHHREDCHQCVRPPFVAKRLQLGSWGCLLGEWVTCVIQWRMRQEEGQAEAGRMKPAYWTDKTSGVFCVYRKVGKC